MRLHIALTQAPRSILNYHLIRDVSVRKELYGDTKKILEISGKNSGLCRPTIVSGLVAINVLWDAISQRPFEL